ncbi:MAG: phosphonate ABC transporter, permease protein PhnE [Acidimicrobiia bacterium]
MTVETHIANDLEPGRQVRPRPPLGPRVFRWVITLAILIPALWSASGLEFSPARFWEAFRPGGQVWDIVAAMVPPDLSSDSLGRTFAKVLESLYIAWIGTILGAVFSFPLAFLGAKNLGPGWLSTGVRQLLNAIRAFPELLLAFIFIPVTGLGAWTGTLAVGLHSVGTLGKLSAEVIEGIDRGPVEAIEASGGSRLSQMRFGVLPQVFPTMVAYWLYRFEINIRASAVLGVVGAGGVGAELLNRLRFREFDRAGTVLFLTILTVLVIDAVSGRVRRRIITGEWTGGLWARLSGRFAPRPDLVGAPPA